MYRYGTGTRSVLLSVKAGGIERLSHHHAFLRSSLGCVRWATGSRQWAAARRRRGSSACAVGSDRVGDTYLSLTLIDLENDDLRFQRRVSPLLFPSDDPV